MDRGDFMILKLDWETDTMEVREVGPVLQQFCGVHGKHIYNITPVVHAMECLAKLNPEEGPPHHFLIDVRYDRENVVAHVHCTEDFHSVVNVPPERLEKVLRPLLTPRETQIAALLFESRTIRYTATALHIAEGTVKRIMHNIYRKLGVGSQVELIREFYTRLAQLEWTPGSE